MNQDLTNLPKSKKKVVAKVLSEKELSLSQIGTLLGVDPSTAMRYRNAEVPEKMQEFAMKIREAFEMKEQVVAAKALARIDESMARARIGEALEVYKVMMGKDRPQTNIRVNNIIPIMQDKKAE